MSKLVRPALLAALVAAAFSVQAQYSQYSQDHDARNGGRNSCESRDGKDGKYGKDGKDGGRWSDSLQVVGLTEDQRLICFNEKSPGEARTIGFVSGLMYGDVLVGIDYRVQDKKLYGVSKTGGIYILDTGTATATLVSQLTVQLEGTSFGVDFNPAADRLRIVSDTGQNLRHKLYSDIVGPVVTLKDDPLDYPPATPVNAIGPNALGVTGSAYTNNDLDPSTATTLYVLDTNLDQIALQSPPNDGTLAATGKLGVDAGLSAGFDIYSTVRDGITVEVQALASLQTAAGASSLYSIKLPTGKATSRGNFSSRNKVIDIAIPLDQL